MKAVLFALFVFYHHTGISQNQFPDGWEGSWRGDLNIQYHNGKEMNLKMALHINAKCDTSWQWKIAYITDSTEDIRDYTLYQKTGSPHYELDEHNGIILNLSNIGNGMYASFGIEDSELMIFYELVDGRLIFRTISSGRPRVSGGSHEIPEVTSRLTMASQRAVLEKVNH